MDLQASGTALGASQVFVGREPELAELHAGLDDAVAGHGRLFLLGGEAGIGKTRLGEEIAAMASARGVRAAWGRCWEGGGAPALWPWIQILRALLHDFDVPQRQSFLAAGSAYLAQLLPDLVDAPPAAVATAARSDAQAAHFPMLDALASVVRHVAAAAPLLLVLDDLHEADEPTLLALDFLARELPGQRILVVATYRDIEIGRVAERNALLNRVARHGKRLLLRGLSESAVADLIEATFHKAAAANVVSAVHHTTAGNPFFVDEVVRLLAANPLCAQLDHVPDAGLPIPGAVRDAVRRRLLPLSRPCLEILQVAAVIGHEINVSVLRIVAAVNADTLYASLDEARAAALIASQPPDAGIYHFEHALIRDTIYDDLPAVPRMHVHQRLGEAMLDYYAADVDAHIAEIAHHFVQAAPCGATRAAVDLATRAGNKAESIFAFEEAAAWFERALHVLADEASESTQTLDLLLKLGACQAKAWDTRSAEETYRCAARRARTALPHDRVAAARSLARAALGFGGTGIGMPRGTANPELVALLEEAAALLGEADAAWKARLQSRLAIELYFADAAERRRALVEEAVDLARLSGDRDAIAYVLTVRLIALWDIPNTLDRLAMADEALLAAQAVASGDLELRARVFRIIDLVELGAFREWMHETERYAETAARLREPIYQSGLVMLRIMNALWLGQFDDAERMCMEALAAAEQLEDLNASISTRLQLFALRRAQGRIAELEPAVRFAASAAAAPPALRCMLAIVDADMGDPAQARSGFEHLAAQDFADLARANHLTSALAWLVELACQFGSPRHLAILHDHVSALARRHLTFPARLCFGPSEYFLALLEAAMGQPREAASHFEAAIEECAKNAARPALAAAQYAYAEMMANGATPATPKIDALLDEARQTAVALTMNGLLAKIDALASHVTCRRSERQSELMQAAGGSAATRVLQFPGKQVSTRSDAKRRGPVGLSGRPAMGDNGESLFRFERELWTVAHQGTVIRLKGSKGLRYLAELMREPQRELHVSELSGLDRFPADTRPATANDTQQSDLRIGSADAGEALVDRRARAEYKAHLADLREQLQEAQSFNDRGRAARLQAEIETIGEALARSFGLRGRSRSAGSQIERQRLNVTRAIQTAIKRIREAHPELGRHLANTVHTGVFCRYEPDPQNTIRWRF